MQDRPTIDELLEAVGDYLLRDVVPSTEGRVSFHGRVAANVIAMVRRELAGEDIAFHEEWTGLDGLLGAIAPPAGLEERRAALAERNRELVRRIRECDGDSPSPALLAHLHAVTRRK